MRCAGLWLALVSALALDLSVGTMGAQAQVLDASRPHEDGCNQLPPPPGSQMARSEQGPVIGARFFGATQIYIHGVLGDEIEAEGLLVQYQDEDRLLCDVVEAGPDRVFEDIAPRLADVDGDGLNEVIVVASDVNRGARLEVYGYDAPGEGLQLLASTPYIGTAFRWLAPIGAADLDGDGHVEIAYIDRPHLAKILRVWRYKDRSLTEVVVQPGFSNHKIGWDYIIGGIRTCGERPEMVIAMGHWTYLVSAWIEDGVVRTRDLHRFTGRDSAEEALNCF